jgi:hypothetical protein
MNVYDVSHVNGDIYEIEADFYQREGEDWVFYAGDGEALRICWLDVLSVSKSSIRPTPAPEDPAERIWL